MTETSSYLLAGGSAELERLRLQARVWESEAEALLDRIGVQAGWRCVDLGVAPWGFSAAESPCGPQGHVIGSTPMLPNSWLHGRLSMNTT